MFRLNFERNPRFLFSTVQPLVMAHIWFLDQLFFKLKRFLKGWISRTFGLLVLKSDRCYRVNNTQKSWFCESLIKGFSTYLCLAEKTGAGGVEKPDKRLWDEFNPRGGVPRNPLKILQTTNERYANQVRIWFWCSKGTFLQKFRVLLFFSIWVKDSLNLTFQT